MHHGRREFEVRVVTSQTETWLVSAQSEQEARDVWESEGSRISSLEGKVEIISIEESQYGD